MNRHLTRPLRAALAFLLCAASIALAPATTAPAITHAAAPDECDNFSLALGIERPMRQHATTPAQAAAALDVIASVAYRYQDADPRARILLIDLDELSPITQLYLATVDAGRPDPGLAARMTAVQERAGADYIALGCGVTPEVGT